MKSSRCCSCRSPMHACQPAADDGDQAGSVPSTPANASTGPQAPPAAHQAPIGLQQQLIGRISTPMGPPAAPGQLSLGSLLVAAQVRPTSGRSPFCFVTMGSCFVLVVLLMRLCMEPCMTARPWQCVPGLLSSGAGQPVLLSLMSVAVWQFVAHGCWHVPTSLASTY